MCVCVCVLGGRGGSITRLFLPGEKQRKTFVSFHFGFTSLPVLPQSDNFLFEETRYKVQILPPSPTVPE